MYLKSIESDLCFDVAYREVVHGIFMHHQAKICRSDGIHQQRCQEENPVRNWHRMSLGSSKSKFSPTWPMGCDKNAHREPSHEGDEDGINTLIMGSAPDTS
jgi:hypothetical protein